MMTKVGTAAVSAARGIIGSLELEILDLDPDVTALIAEVDAILCAALTPARRPPAPPVTGSDFLRPDRLDGPAVRRSATMRAAVPNVRAVQRSPPVPDRSRDEGHYAIERQVMASQQR
jgi:hypothetical protein